MLNGGSDLFKNSSGVGTSPVGMAGGAEITGPVVAQTVRDLMLILYVSVWNTLYLGYVQ